MTVSPRWLVTSSFSLTMPCDGRLWSRFSATVNLETMVSPMKTGLMKRSLS